MHIYCYRAPEAPALPAGCGGRARRGAELNFSLFAKWMLKPPYHILHFILISNQCHLENAHPDEFRNPAWPAMLARREKERETSLITALAAGMLRREFVSLAETAQQRRLTTSGDL